MRFSRLELTNWRNFRSASIKLQPRTFIVGPNAAGKSNLLDALRFLRELAEDGGGLQRAVVEQRQGLRSIRSLHARAMTQVGVAVRVEDEETSWHYDVVLEGKSSEPPLVQTERVRRTRPSAPPGQPDEVLGTWRRDVRLESTDLRKRTWLEQPGARTGFLPLAEFFASIEYSHVVPQVVREQRRPSDQARRRDPFGSSMIEEMSLAPAGDRKRRLGLINQALKAVLPKLRDITIKRDQQGMPHLNGNYAHWRAPGAHQSETQFSDGTLRLIGLLWTLSADGGPILLEEPEISLHESAVVQLPVILHRVAQSSGRQVIVSTHSAALLNDRGIEPREIVLLETTDEDTQVRSGDEIAILGELADADAPLGTTLIGMTAPDDVAQLSRGD